MTFHKNPHDRQDCAKNRQDRESAQDSLFLKLRGVEKLAVFRLNPVSGSDCGLIVIKREPSKIVMAQSKRREDAGVEYSTSSDLYA